MTIVQSTTSPGPITVRTSSDGLLPATATLYSRPVGGSGLTAIEPVYLRVMKGSAAALPASVVGVDADGGTRSLPVNWAPAPGRHARPGVYTVTGAVQGMGIPARALVTVYDVAWVTRTVAVVPVGTPPDPAVVAKVVYSDGVTQYLPVRWPRIAPRRYSTPGRLSARGRITGISTPASLLVTVTRHFKPDQNLALASGPEHAAADASFSGGVFADGGSDFGTSTTVPAAMLDGNTTSGGWSNRYGKGATQTLPEITNARPGDWVSVSWPAPQSFSELRPYFTVDANNQLPASVRVSYWNGLCARDLRG